MANKKASMTERERVEAILNRQTPDRIPTWPMTYDTFCALYTGCSLSDSYNHPEIALPAIRKTSKDFGWVFFPYMAYGGMGAWEFGGEVKWPTSEYEMAPIVVRYAVKTPEEAMEVRMPDVKNAGCIPIMERFLEMSSQERLDDEPFNLIYDFAGPFTAASNICGPENFVKWLLKYPKAAEHLLRVATDYVIGLIEYFTDRFGMDGALPYLFEPTTSNQLISPKLFEKFALPYIKELQEKILAMGYKTTFIHICGEQNLNMPLWSQIPFGDPGIVSFGHEVDLETAAKYFPNDVVFGNVEPTIIQIGTEDQIYEACRKTIEKGKSLSTGYIFSCGCSLPPRAAVENISQMTKALNDFGWYA